MVIEIKNQNDILRVQASLLQIQSELANGKVFDVEIKEHKDKRSLDANAYCWTLLDKIAEKLKTDKIAIYREIIKRVGVFDIVCVQNKSVDKLCENWTKKGLGWQYDRLKSKVPNCENVVLYYGTSTYDTKEMSRLIDEIVEEAKRVGVETRTPEQIAELKSLWSEYETKNK